jgi:hypothetical protein
MPRHQTHGLVTYRSVWDEQRRLGAVLPASAQQLGGVEHPTAHWTAQQIVDAFPNDSATSYLLRDRDSVYGGAFRHRVKGMRIEEVLTAHLRRVLVRYFSYYHRARTHLSLDKDAPEGRPIEPPPLGAIIPIPEVGGLHHRYVRRAA